MIKACPERDYEAKQKSSINLHFTCNRQKAPCGVFHEESVLMQGWLMTREAPCEVRENGAGGSSLADKKKKTRNI